LASVALAAAHHVDGRRQAMLSMAQPNVQNEESSIQLGMCVLGLPSVVVSLVLTMRTTGQSR